MQINDFIYHEKYGIGKITSLDGRFITVDFSDTQKQFLKSDGTKFLKPAIQNQFVVVSGELISYVGSSQKIVLPHQVHAIGAKAFANAKFLYSIDLGCHVSRIDSRAFENCANLEKVMGTHGLSVFWALPVSTQWHIHSECPSSNTNKKTCSNSTFYRE